MRRLIYKETELPICHYEGIVRPIKLSPSAQ